MTSTKQLISGLLFCLLSAALSGTALASQYSTFVISNDKRVYDILIDYTICSNELEKNPTCSTHMKRWIHDYEGFKLSSQDEKLYIWSAFIYGSDGQLEETNYSKNIQGSNNKVHVVSDCVAASKSLVVLDTYGTRSIIGCHIDISG